MTKFWRHCKITRRGKNNQGSNLLTEAIAAKEAKIDAKKSKPKAGGKK